MSAPTTRRQRTVDSVGSIALAGRAFAYWLTQYRRTWRGSAVTSLLEPLGFLAAMGIGLGTLVDRGTGSATLPGVSYLEFLAPGLLAATAMQTASFESSYPVMGAIKWQRQYHAMLATPLGVVDLLAGHLMFVAFRLVTTLTVFVAVMGAFGAIGSPWGVFALPVAVLTGMAYATVIFAFSVRQDTDGGFAMLFRFAIMPMFLFSGTFFPVSQLPGWLEPVAWVTPLWHGVELCRSLALGTPQMVPALLHVGYLAVWSVAGFVVARRCFERRLET